MFRKFAFVFLLSFLFVSCAKYRKITVGGVSCLKMRNGDVLLCLEEYLDSAGIEYDICGRCGYLSVLVDKQTGDVVQFNWNTPYVSWQNRDDEMTLPAAILYEEGKTWVVDDEKWKSLLVER